MTPVSPRRRAWLLAALCLAIACVASWLGANYIRRLPHHDGYFLVDVDDPVRVPLSSPPHRATLVVVDGLRRDSALGMATVAKLAQAGQCRTADVGSYTVSRPVYALLSTGLEVDRSGSRNNAETAALTAESVWDVAVGDGLGTAMSSHLPWWQQLFPVGLQRAVVLSEDEDVFAAAAELGADLSVIHPVYVDTVGHASGADSTAYADAVARVDREALAWLDTVDLEHELVVFTADHGHVAAGGHGANQPEVRRVLVCFAGSTIARRDDGPAIDSRVIAPAITVGLGLRFPKNMRAVEDDLDQLWTIFDEETLPPAYVADRRRSVEAFRERNTEALAGWLGSEQPPTWTQLFEREGRARWWKIASVLALIAAGVGFAVKLYGLDRRQACQSVGWILQTFLTTCALWVLLRGGFDYTTINDRSHFIPNSLAVCGGTALVMAVLHVRYFKDPARWAADQAMLAGTVVALSLAHVVAFGWPLGFPVPHRIVLFFPFFAATFGAVHGLLGCAAAIRLARTLGPSTETT